MRRRAAAKYHLDAVIALKKKEVALLETASERLAESSQGDLKFRSYSGSSFRLAHEFVHELSAFLAALRSGVDFVARIAMRSLPGINGDSISAIIKAATKGVSGPILDEVMQNLDWLSDLKDYRDEIVHRLVVQAPVAGWHVSHHGKTSTQTMPIIVPQHAPKNLVPDTRAARMMDQETPDGLSLSKRHGSVNYSDGTTEVVDHSIEYVITEDFVEIEEFMSQHLLNYDGFVKTMLNELIALNFQVATVLKK